jgi:hypothetical protein
MNGIQMDRALMAARYAGIAGLLALLAGPVSAQGNTSGGAAAPDSIAITVEHGDWSQVLGRGGAQMTVIQHLRPHDVRGINMFEAPKEEGAPYDGFKLEWGAAFTQEYQGLSHKNTADTVLVAGVNKNELVRIGNGFNNAQANLYMDAQLARGIRVEMTSYLSSRHHNETWVKDGYLLIDGSPYDIAVLNHLMQYLTLRVGHFEINYGDAHFRRTDNGEAMFNPLVGNLIMDAFTTEIGAEAYLRAHGLMGMVGVTGGEVRGQVTQPQNRSSSYLGKVGFDRMMGDDTRVRLTGSIYSTAKSVNNTLYSGSRAGSRYFDVLENTASTEAAQAWSGDIQPGLRSKITAMVFNPFIKFHGLEIFGNVEQAKGRATAETSDRKWTQNAGEVLYRFAGNQLYAAGRYNVVKGRFAGFANDVTVNRTQIGGGWFITGNLMAKGEYVKQQYKDFPTTDIRNGGEFSGMMVEGVVTF